MQKIKMKPLAITLLLIIFFMQSASPQTWQKLDDIANSYYKKKNYDSALVYAEKALTAAEREFTRTGANYDTALCRLASVCKAAKKESQLVAYYEEILQLRISKFEEQDPNIANGLYSTSQIFKTLHDDYKKAIPVYEKAIEFISSIDTLDWPLISDLSAILSDANMPHEQDSVNIQHLAGIKQQYGYKSKQYLNALDSLCSNYKSYGKFRQVIPLYEEYFTLYKELHIAQTPEYAAKLANMGFCYYATSRYKSAMQYYEEAVAVWRKCGKTKSADYGTSLFFLACTYMNNLKTDIALPLLEEAAKVLYTANGIKDPYYSTCLSFAAYFRLLKGDYLKAEKYYTDCYNAVYNPSDTTENNSMVLISYLQGLGYIYDKTNRPEKADSIYALANKNSFRFLNKFCFIYSPFTSETGVSKYLSWFKFHKNSFYSYFVKRYLKNPSLASYLYDDELINKGMVLRFMKSKISAILNSGDSALIRNFDDWIQLRQQLSKLYLIPISERKVDILALEKQVKDIEDQIYFGLYKYYDAKNRNVMVSWKDVQNNLKDGEAAVEFISFNYYSIYQSLSDSVIYCALVLRPGYKYPKMVYLFSEENFADFLGRTHKSSPSDNIKQLYSWAESGDSLYNFIWKPIDSLLHDCKKIYYAPSGLLHKISFPAIPVGDSTMLIDIYNLQMLSSTGSIAIKKEPFTISENYEALLYGGILYDADTAALENSAKKYRGSNSELFYRDRSFRWSDMQGGATWPYLEGTLTEAQQIGNIMKNFHIKTKIITGADAVEESFKFMPPYSPQIIHIATHGFFFPEEKQKKKTNFMQTDDNYSSDIDYSLLRSGLIFAGANYIFKGEPPVQGIDDGILTAYEISGLNLRNTKLVVLSACETGLGEIKGSEGVYGLQRAFKLAGADYLIMSLWQIPDEQTVEMMRIFYKSWLGGKEIQEAFTTAQMSMRKKYAPFYWASFVLVE